MQGLLSKLRSVVASSRTLPFSLSSSSSFRRAFITTSALHHPGPFLLKTSIFNPVSRTQLPIGFQVATPLSLFQLNQTRHVSKAKERRMKRLTPAVSKLKKYKIKPYSSFKRRFKTLKDGQIRRWHAGKRHNAHLKSKISKRRLRLPALVHPAYAKVMKKLNFSG